MYNYTSEEEREQISLQAKELRDTVQVEKNKLFHYRNFFIASIILIVFFSNKSFDLLLQFDLLSIVIEIIFITFSFLMFLFTYAALDNLRFTKQMLWMYETPVEEVERQFEEFCDFENKH